MVWIIAGVGIAALVALGVAARVLVLILAELQAERGDTEDDPIDWGAESTDELTPAASAARR